MLRRLRARIALLAALLTGAVLTAALVFAFEVTCRQYTNSRCSAFEAAVTQLQYQWDRYDQLDGDWLARLEAQNGMKTLLTENGKPLLHSLRLGEEERALLEAAKRAAEEQQGLLADAPPLAGGQSASFTFSAQGGVWRGEVRLDGGAGGRWTGLVAVQDLAPERAHALRMAALFALVAAAGWAGLALAGWFIAGRAVRPVARAMDQQQQFLRAAGHELRTPLAVIRANAGAARCQPGRAETYLDVIDGEARRMGQLVDELLLLSAGAAARERLRPEALEPDTFLLDFAEGMEPLARQSGRRLAVRLPKDAPPPVCADRSRLRQLLTILLDNALRFAPAGSSVELGLAARSGRVRVSVADRGPGVADKDKKRIFERFYRADPSGDAGHWGLGLAVAAELAALHGGRLWVEDAPGGGALFLLELPRADDPATMQTGRGLDR